MRLAATLAVCALAGCSSGQEYGDSLSVSDVIRDHENLDGKAIRVHGWVQHCNPLSCVIVTNQSFTGEALTLGGSDEFDKAVASYSHPIAAVVEAKVNATCFDHGGEPDAKAKSRVVCIDRAGELVEPKLIHVFAR